ncbi:hypothetical protein K5X82_11500 [Halosquirtibacter xylanolyticus]|uniref:hypothetical protein n=1 Tax=Halosquirtibacter xylanolyticus TaxID=3374599 RepID=UPI0037488602|nr:hypothetical protein K5X82_11500 [Prolixibacteraceae bacterium]
MNSSIATIEKSASQEVKVVFKKQPLSFKDVGPIWLKENPSNFAKEGVMTKKLKETILNNIKNK